MARVSKKYATLGLRRDRNLSDVPNRRTALNNLLNNLVTPEPGKTFITDDLDAIRGLQNSNIYPEKLETLANTTIQYSVLVQNDRYLKPSTSISVSGSTVTVNTVADHGLVAGDTIYILNSVNKKLDGVQTVSSTDTATQFTFTINNSSGAAGEHLVKVTSMVSDGAFPRSQITVTTNLAHSLSAGDLISFSNSASAATNGNFQVFDVKSPTVFTFTASDKTRAVDLKTTQTTGSFETVVSETKVSTIPVDPLITLKDRVENVKVVTGRIPAFEGGQGLMATFIESAQINVGSMTSTGEPGPDTTATGFTPVATGIFDRVNSQFSEIFWDRGYFSFGSNLDTTFNDQYGGIQWNGYFSPTLYDAFPFIGFEGTSNVLIEYKVGTSTTWVIGASHYAGVREVRTSGASTVVNGKTEIPMAAITGGTPQDAGTKYIGEKDYLGYYATPVVEAVTRTASKDYIRFNGTYAITANSTLRLYDINRKVLRKFTVSAVTNSGGKTTVEVPLKSALNVNINDKIINLYYKAGTTDIPLQVEDIQYGTKIICNYERTGSFANNETILFVKELGKDLTKGGVQLPATEIGGKIPIRISIWWPNTGDAMVEKSIQFSYIGEQLDFPNMYAVKPSDVLQPYELRQFLKEIITPTQPELGGKQISAPGDYERSLYVNNTFLATYTPKSSLTQIKTFSGSPTIYFNTNSRIITSSVELLGVEIGNIIVPTVARTSTKLNTILRIEDSINLSIKVANAKLSTVTADNTAEVVNIIDHKGFINWFYVTSSGTNNTTLTLTEAGIGTLKSMADLRVNFTVISANTTDTQFARITAFNTTAKTITISESVGVLTDALVYIYADRGLIDSSKDVLCDQTFGQVVAVEAPVNALRLVLKSSVGVAAGQVLYYGASLTTVPPLTAAVVTVASTPAYLGPAFTVNGYISGTTLTINTSSFNGTHAGMYVSDAGVAANTYINTFTSATQVTVTVSQTVGSAGAPVTFTIYPVVNISSPGVKSTSITASSTVVFAKNSASLNTIDRESCVIPKDTAPPFSGTDVGLKTNSKNGVGISIQSTNTVGGTPSFRVDAISLSATVPTSQVVTVKTNDVINRTVKIINQRGSNPAVTYYIQGTNSGA